MERTGRGRRLLLSLSFLCLAVLLLPLPGASPATAGRKRRMGGFDHYVLALQWPGTVCRQTNHCCSSNGCCRSNPLNWFTIHGLWPQYSSGGWPSCCRATTPFNMNKIAMLRGILEKYWPSLYCGDSSTCFGGKGPFWVHEYLTFVVGVGGRDAWNVRLPRDTGRVRLLLHRALPLQQIQRHESPEEGEHLPAERPEVRGVAHRGGHRPRLRDAAAPRLQERLRAGAQALLPQGLPAPGLRIGGRRRVVEQQEEPLPSLRHPPVLQAVREGERHGGRRTEEPSGQRAAHVRAVIQ